MNQEFCLTQSGQAGRLIEQRAFARTNTNADRDISPLWLRGHVEFHSLVLPPLYVGRAKNARMILSFGSIEMTPNRESIMEKRESFLSSCLSVA
jgi:hypothetical protein